MTHNDIHRADESPSAMTARGFLPETDPRTELPGIFGAWEEVARDLPRLLVCGKTRAAIDALPLLDASTLEEGPVTRRAMLLLSFMGHAYVWGGETPSLVIPANLAVPWHGVAVRLGRPPVLSYASYALDNWRRLDARDDIALGNIALLQRFLGGADEEWFITVHIDIEAKAASALAALPEASGAAKRKDVGGLERSLTTIAESLSRMYGTLCRMPEWCDPYIYFTRVRPFIHGWSNHPALPEGVVYEGVYGNQPQRFRGETGAQSSIVPALDAVLGVLHRPDPLRDYLIEMRDYMPPSHRRFIESLEESGSVRDFVLSHARSEPALLETYNACVSRLHAFREKHLEYAARYIHLQHQRAAANPSDVGTGGTPFMRYLAKHRDETAEHRAVALPHAAQE